MNSFRFIRILFWFIALPLYGGCGGSSGPSIFIVSGRAQYEKNVVSAATMMLTGILTLTPITRALIEVRETASGAVVATGVTDATGNFSIGVPIAQQAATLKVVVQASTGPTFFVVSHITPFPIYEVASAPFTGGQTSLTITATYGGARLAGPFNIFATILRGFDFIRAVDPTAAFEVLAVLWDLGDSTSLPPCTCYLSSGGNHVIGIQDNPADENDMDDSVILHEFGHYLETVFGHRSSPGGDHFLAGAIPVQDLDPRLAFGEGWGNAFAQMVLRDPIYVDTKTAGGFKMNLETVTIPPTGIGSEAVIGGVFWDIYDGSGSGVPSLDGDTINSSFSAIWTAMKSLRQTPHVYIVDLAAALFGQGAVTPAEWNNNFTVLGLSLPMPAFPPFFLISGSPGAGQVNCSLGHPAPSPPITVTQNSLAAANQYFLVSVFAATTLTVNVVITDPITNDLDLLLWEDPAVPGLLLASSMTASGTETVVIPVAPGDYLVQVRANKGKVGSATASFIITASW